MIEMEREWKSPWSGPSTKLAAFIRPFQFQYEVGLGLIADMIGEL